MSRSATTWEEIVDTPQVSTRDGVIQGGCLRVWSYLPAEIQQPALTHHLLAVNLDTTRRVSCLRGRVRHEADVAHGDTAFAPAGSEVSWFPGGMNDFAHLYIDPMRLSKIYNEAFDAGYSSVDVQFRSVLSDPLVSRCLRAAVEEVRNSEKPSAMFLNNLVDTILMKLARVHWGREGAPPSVRIALAPFRLRRVKEYIREHLTDDLNLEQLAAVAGLSQYHFSRAFHRETGITPYAYVIQQRLDQVKVLLRRPDLTIKQAAALSGFRNASRFAVTFRKATGRTAKEWREHL